MKRILCSALLGAAMLVHSVAQAATCVGTFQGVSIEPSSGEIMLERVNLTSGDVIWWVRFCSLRTPANGVPLTNGITAEVCKSIYASLLAAQAQSKSITFYTSDSNCTTRQPWQFVPGFSFFTVNN